jgi:GAF domain-containing protein
VAGRAILDRTVVHVPDIALDGENVQRALAQAVGWRSCLAAPMLRDGAPIGVITVGRALPGRFSASEIELLKTFGDQAVIAIENVRLFKELETRNRDLTSALDRETATSEVLRVISSSPTDTQPVFDAIVQSAVTLCGAILGAIYRREGDLVHVVGLDRRYPEADEVRAVYPAPVTSALMPCRAIHENAIIHLPDTETAGVLPPEGLRLARLSGFRSVVAVPMRREGDPIGAILVGRPAVGPFPDEQIVLLQTFADQAVIAIENVRLFTELQTSNRELTTALDTQTATSDILRVISRSQTDVQPVFDAIVASAVRLLRGYASTMTRLAGDLIELVAFMSTDPAGDDAIRASYPRALDSGGAIAEALRTGIPVNVADVEAAPRRSSTLRATARVRGYRSAVGVPLLRHGSAVGTMSVGRVEPGGFTDDEIALLQTFADQAVIAIENVRLFTELQQKNEALTQAHAHVTEALEQQTATAEILRVISQSPTDVQPVFETIVTSAVRLCGGRYGALYRFDGTFLHIGALFNATPELREQQARRFPTAPNSETLAGLAIQQRRTLQIHDVETDPDVPPAAVEGGRILGYRSQISVPMLRDGMSSGVSTSQGRNLAYFPIIRWRCSRLSRRRRSSPSRTCGCSPSSRRAIAS